MGTSRIESVGAYLPLLRMERRSAAVALKWSGLPTPRTGHRAVAGWDEDALTLAVEAARVTLADHDPSAPLDIIFASTSAYFLERPQAPILLDALALPRAARTLDVAGSRRCAVSALHSALDGGAATLVVAGEKRQAAPGSASHLTYGDGATAIRTGPCGNAELIGAASLARDLVDVYASRDHPDPYPAEERFVRDVAVNEILAPTIAAALSAAGIAATEIAWAAVAEPVAGCYSALAKKLGLGAQNLAMTLAESAGDLGAAHPLFALALALDAAAPGDLVLLAGFGGGCDALIFRVDGPVSGAASATAALHEGVATGDYLRFLSLTGGVALDWGVRAEFEQKAQASVLGRHGREMHGFIGGADPAGIVQFPKSRIPVSGGAPAPLADVRLANEPAKVVSITADRLNFTPDPPFRFGLVQFGNGARVLMEFTDIEGKPPAVGDALRMRFRIKAIERRRGFRTYFWKAAPVARPVLEA